MPPPTAMKSLWQAAVACCAALNSAASRLSITILRPSMPPAALHQSAKAVACSMNSTSRPGRMVLEASLNTAMLMLLSPTPRTEEVPPGPGSHILPTPGHTPLELDADVAAAAVVDEAAMDVPVRITADMASGIVALRSDISPLQNILTPSPESFAVELVNQYADRSVGRTAHGRRSGKKMRSPYPPPGFESGRFLH